MTVALKLLKPSSLNECQFIVVAYHWSIVSDFELATLRPKAYLLENWLVLDQASPLSEPSGCGTSTVLGQLFNRFNANLTVGRFQNNIGFPAFLEPC